MRYQENIQKKEGKHHANQYSAAKTDRTTIPDDPHGLHYGKDQIFKRRRQQSNLKDHTLSDRTICNHHCISGRLYPKHYERTGSCMYRICDPAVFITVCHMDYGKNVSFKHGGIHICLLFQLRQLDRTISHLYLRKRMGHLRLWTHCKCKISGETEISLKKILLNINMISVFAGVFLFFTKIRFPEIIGNTLSSVGSMIGPLSMIVTGMLIAGVDLKKVFTNKRIYLVTFIRLVIEPIIALAVIILLGMKNWHPQAENIILITYMAAITPCASTITQMCQVYGNDSKYASAINVMTTLLAVVTMPVFVYFYMNL